MARRLIEYRYQSKLASSPLLTQSVTTAVCTASFDSKKGVHARDRSPFTRFPAVTPQDSCSGRTTRRMPCARLQTNDAVQVLFATGDVMAQQGVEKVGLDKHNLARSGRMAAYGGGKSISIILSNMPSSLLSILSQNYTDVFSSSSRLWPRSNKMVQFPRFARQSLLQERYHCCTRSRRSIRLRPDQHGRLPLVNGVL